MMMSNELWIHGGTAAMEMEVQKGPKSLKMTLDHYLDFLHSDHNQFHLSPNHLRQEGRTEAVRSIELTEPARSTITNGDTAGNVPSRSCITLAEAIKDLSLLQWQECCVTSLQTLNSTASPIENNHGPITTTTTTTFASPTSSTKKKSKSLKKPKSSSSSSKKTNASATDPTAAAASAVTNHSDPTQPPQLEMEPAPRLMLCDVDPGDVSSSALVVLPAKRKKKGIVEMYNQD